MSDDRDAIMADDDENTSEVSDDEDPFAMANLPPRLTGLPMVVWASERMGARHDVRVKVRMAHGQRIDPGNLAVVAVRPAPRLIAGHLAPADLRAVGDWIKLNEAVLVDYWDGRMGTLETGCSARSG
jgi:hypothetical protein